MMKTYAPILLIGVLAIAAVAPGLTTAWDLFGQFAGPALTVSASLWLAALLAARRDVSWPAGLCALSLLWIGAPQWTPAYEEPQPNSPVLTLYSASIDSENTDVAAVITSVRRANADILVLIEVGDAVDAQLKKVLKNYPYQVVSYAAPHQTSRSIIASRRPLKRWESHGPGLHEVSVVAETALGPVTLVGVHLTRPWPFRFKRNQAAEVQELVGIVHAVDGPLIVAGDFNSTSSGITGTRMRMDAGLKAVAGWPGTWPSAAPAALGITIDQVYSSKELTALGRIVGPKNGSDHRPVITRFALKKS